MFAYFTIMNGTNIITYMHDMGRLYFDEDEDDCDRGSGDSSDSSDGSRYEEMPPPQLQPPLFSYC